MTDLIQYKDFDEFKVRKYKRKVFFNNLWDSDPLLLESRGHVLDKDNNLLARPFKKIFNYKENNTVIDLDQEVIAVKKVNGFMFHVTQHEDFIIEGTTGSLDSPFTKLAKENMIKHGVNYDAFKEILNYYKEPMTCIFEIKDNTNDPHIIDDEEDGVYLLGIRYVSSGKLLSQEVLDNFALLLGVKRPEWNITKFGEVLELVQEVKHEGFVVYDVNTHDGLLKLKSPFYISKKSLMRKSADNVYNKEYKSLVDEEYYPLIEKIRELYTLQQWSILNVQERGKVFEIVYKSLILSIDEMIELISIHSKLSYNLKDDAVKIEYDHHAKYFILTVDVIRGVGYTFNEAIKNLYINVMCILDDHDYKNDTIII